MISGTETVTDCSRYDLPPFESLGSRESLYIPPHSVVLSKLRTQEDSSFLSLEPSFLHMFEICSFFRFFQFLSCYFSLVLFLFGIFSTKLSAFLCHAQPESFPSQSHPHLSPKFSSKSSSKSLSESSSHSWPCRSSNLDFFMLSLFFFEFINGRF